MSLSKSIDGDPSIPFRVSIESEDAMTFGFSVSEVMMDVGEEDLRSVGRGDKRAGSDVDCGDKSSQVAIRPGFRGRCLSYVLHDPVRLKTVIRR